jgi:hypothetical protein
VGTAARSAEVAHGGGPDGVGAAAAAGELGGAEVLAGEVGVTVTVAAGDVPWPFPWPAEPELPQAATRAAEPARTAAAVSARAARGDDDIGVLLR